MARPARGRDAPCGKGEEIGAAKRNLNCWICTAPFTAARNDAVACSPRCNTIKRHHRGKGILLESPDANDICDGCGGGCDISRWRSDEGTLCYSCADVLYEIRITRRGARRYPIGATRLHRGYVFEKVGNNQDDHHRADKSGWVPQHILVAERKFGFPITREFTVHHRNNSRSDNRPENLELRVGNHGYGGEIADTVLASPELRELIIEALERYGYEVRPRQAHCA